MSTVRHPRAGRETPVEPPREFHPPQGEEQTLLATNTGVRLACTTAAMLSPFAAFLCWAEKKSGVIRRFAVQSVALTGVHLCGALLLALLSALVGQVSYLGFLLTLAGWLIYVAAALVVLALRIRLMECAWHGRGYRLPLLERRISRYY